MTNKITEQQEKAIQHIGLPLLIVAGPGTGKTRVLIEKEILKDDYDEILVNGNSLVKDAKSIDEIFNSWIWERNDKR